MHLNNRKKVVLLSAFYEPYMSGAEQMVKKIVECLGNNYEIMLITGRFNTKLLKQEDMPTFKLVRVGIGHRQIDKLLYPLLAAFKTRSVKPQITHAIMESYAGLALVLVKYFYPKTKRILTLQSGDLDHSSKQDRFYIGFFWKKIHCTPHKITAISSFLAKRAENFNISPENILITPNGFDFSEVPKSVEKIPNRVICAGRLSWEKAHKYILEAWTMVLKKFPNAKLIFAGEGPERKNIEELIKKLELTKSVTLTGILPHNQVLAEIKKSEVFICPSLAEGLGVVFIEAQACGVPVIGTNVGGIPDIIQNNQNGLLVEPRNSKEIAGAIIKFLQNKNLASQLSDNALKTVRKYNWINTIKQFDKLYREI